MGWTFWYAVLFWPALCLAAGFAIRSGGTGERMAAFVYCVGACTELVLKFVDPNRFAWLNPVQISIDLGIAGALLWIATRFQRRWAILACAFHLVVMLGHIAKMIYPGMSHLSYALMTGMAAYPSILLLVLGTYRHAHLSRSSTN